MSQSQKRIDLLSKKLETLDIMTMSELSGLLAGVVVCPDFLPPSAWFPVVLMGDDGEQVEIEEEEIEPLASLVMEHYSGVIADLDAGCYGAVYAADVDTDELVWQMWVEGFMQAMGLAPDSWMPYLDSPDEDISGAFSMLAGLVGIVMDENELDEETTAEFVANAADIIPACIIELHRARRKLFASGMPVKPVRQGPKIGRNDPCPCGSGKKYKKCCGLN